METFTNDWDAEELAECAHIAAALNLTDREVAAMWEKYSEEHFAGWLTGLEDTTPERFLELMKTLDNSVNL